MCQVIDGLPILEETGGMKEFVMNLSFFILD